jgi:hypothetical protein
MLSDAIDKADLNSLPTELQQIRLGQLLQCAIPQNRSAVNHNTAAANPYVLATLQAARLGYVPAAVILRATVKAGAVTGELAPQLYGVTPATTQCAVAPNGDIVTLAADAITDLDITYIPEMGDIYEVTLPVPTSGIVTLPAFIQAMKPKLLCEAELTVGAVVGKKIVLIPANSNPATGRSNLGLAKTTVYFTAADVGASQGTARLKLLVASQTNAAALLAATETT